jgi:hypothetical protein
VQRAMAERNAEIAEDKRISFRIGVNLGDVIIDDDDIYGDGVNVAARLEALAEPGGLCISRVVRDQIRDKLPYSFEGNDRHPRLILRRQRGRYRIWIRDSSRTATQACNKAVYRGGRLANRNAGHLSRSLTERKAPASRGSHACEKLLGLSAVDLSGSFHSLRKIPLWVKDGPLLWQARSRSKGPLSDQVADATKPRGQCRSWVESGRTAVQKST